MKQRLRRLVRAHEREIKRRRVEVFNYGAATTGNGIASKTSDGWLETTIGPRGGIQHRLTR